MGASPANFYFIHIALHITLDEMVPEQSISMTQIYEKIWVCYGSCTEGIMQLWVDQILVLELRAFVTQIVSKQPMEMIKS